MIGNLLRTALFLCLLAATPAPALQPTRRPSPSWVARSTRRLTPRRSTMRSSSRPTVSSPRSAAAAKSRFPAMRGSSTAPERPSLPASGTATSTSRKNHGETPASAPAAPLEEHMQAMLTRWGFTTVWDLGSDPNDTLPLRRRVNSGEVPGPASCLPAASSPGTAIPPMCRLRCRSPKPPRRRRPRNCRATTSDWAKTASNSSPAPSRVRQAGREHGSGHCQGRGRCRACRRASRCSPIRKIRLAWKR